MGRKLKHDYVEIYNKHKQGYSVRQLSKLFDCPIGSIYHNFIKNNWEYNRDIPIQRENKCVNHDFFNVIDTEEKAYFIGILLADGYVYKNRLSLKLKSEDGYLVRELYSLFTKNYLILDKVNNGRSFTSAMINSNKITKNLSKFGIIQNKTIKGFSLPDIDNQLFRHFIRGYFDGDGSISKKSNSDHIQVYICSIDKSFLESIQSKLKEFDINSNIYLENRNGKPLKTPSGNILNNCKDMYTLRIDKIEDKLKLYEFLYNDCSIKMNRKYNMFNEYYVNTVLTLENKGSKAVQRIGNEPFVDFNKLKNFCFYSWKEVPDMEYLKKLYFEDKLSMNKISKILNWDRTSLKDRLDKYMKEYNLPTSAQTLPSNVEG